MKKVTLITILVSLLLITGCTDEDPINCFWIYTQNIENVRSDIVTNMICKFSSDGNILTAKNVNNTIEVVLNKLTNEYILKQNGATVVKDSGIITEEDKTWYYTVNTISIARVKLR